MNTTIVQLSPPDSTGGNGPETQPATPVIRNADFWPDIDVEHYRRTIRQDGTIPYERLREYLIQAMAETNRQLAEYAAVQKATGYLTLSGVPADKIDGESVQMQRYRRAVYSATRALITEQFRGTDTTQPGDMRAQSLESTTAELWRQFQWAISDIQGRSHTVVELI
ncbi:head completion/stabilization protein [Salmonella enterica subsp. enterica]|uniref:Head completion/stabilization protein n=1 Tax=Salmonella enterica I TaxID=59201 RepID=A0A5U3ER21_SALET|nr:head completion/stabilization protein [Salmonella enterica subsp. enterica]